MQNMIKSIGKKLNTYHRCLNQELPLDYDYDKDFGMYFMITNISTTGYKDVATLDIHFIGLDKHKGSMYLAISRIAKEMDKELIEDLWLTKKSNWYIDTRDNEYNHIILTFDINRYK